MHAADVGEEAKYPPAVIRLCLLITAYILSLKCRSLLSPEDSSRYSGNPESYTARTEDATHCAVKLNAGLPECSLLAAEAKTALKSHVHDLALKQLLMFGSAPIDSACVRFNKHSGLRRLQPEPRR